MTAKPRALCLRPLADFEAVGVAVPDGVDVTYTRGDLPSRIPEDVSCLVLASAGPPLPAAVFSEAAGLRLLQYTGAGTDRVSIELAARLGCAVCNVPGASAPDVAAYVVIATGLLARNLLAGYALVRSGNFEKGRRELGPHLVRGFRGLRVGVVGLGSIGSEVTRLFHGLGASVGWFDRERLSGPAFARREPDLEALAARSDVLTIHVPLDASTAGLVGASELAALPPGAIIVNASRGGVLDEQAAVDALEAGHLGGLALDVFEQEPPDAGSAIVAAARRHPHRVLLTPHVAGVTLEASRQLFGRAWANVERVLVHGLEPCDRVA